MVRFNQQTGKRSRARALLTLSRRGPQVFALILAAYVFTTDCCSAAAPSRDGSRDFDFLIGDWKARARQLPDRLHGSDKWITFVGTEHHFKILESNANIEEFEVDNPTLRQHLHAQTLRLYNSVAHQWSMYLMDLNAGTMETTPFIGAFYRNRGEFFRKEILRGREISARYVWFKINSKSARMEQSYSGDRGKTWEINWICELTRR